LSPKELAPNFLPTIAEIVALQLKADSSFDQNEAQKYF